MSVGGGGGPGGGLGGGGGSTASALGLTAFMLAALTLILLRLARRAASKPIWRAYLPEVPPA